MRHDLQNTGPFSSRSLLPRSSSRLISIVALSLAVLVTGGCATQQRSPREEQEDTAGKIASAATAPLTDLNLVQIEVARVLVDAKTAPYRMPVSLTCEQFAIEVAALDAILGADLDIPPTEENPGLIERGASEVGNAAVGALRRTTEGLLPFRSWVRRLTGAEQHARDVAAAISAGIVRRAYLKGLGDKTGCSSPAAPYRPPPSQRPPLSQ